MQPEQLDSTLRAFQESRILLTAIELNIFTFLGGGTTASEAASRMGADPRATRMLLDALVSLDLIEKHGEVYSNTDLSARLLVDSSPESTRAAMLHDVHRWRTWSNLTGRIRGEAPPEEHRTLDTERHRALLAMLDRKSVERAPKLIRAIGVEGAKRILDLGCGSAAYSIAFARAGEGIGATAFDLPEVLPITAEYIARAGMRDRIRTQPGDLLTSEFGSGFDLVLLFSVTHLLGEQENRSLLARCCSALNPGGRVAIHDHILDEDKTHPRTGAIFALNMLVATRNGGTYSFAEYSSWLRDAGFSAVERRKLEGAPTGIVIGVR